MPYNLSVTQNLGPIYQNLLHKGQRGRDKLFHVNRYLLPLTAAKSQPTCKTLIPILFFRLAEMLRSPFGRSYRQNSIRGLKAAPNVRNLKPVEQDFFAKTVLQITVNINNLQKSFPKLDKKACTDIMKDLLTAKLREKGIPLK